MPHYKHHTLASSDHSDVRVSPGLGEPHDGDALVWHKRPGIDTVGAQAEVDAFPGLQNMIDLTDDFPTTDNGYWAPGTVTGTGGTSTGSEASRAFAFFVAG